MTYSDIMRGQYDPVDRFRSEGGKAFAALWLRLWREQGKSGAADWTREMYLAWNSAIQQDRIIAAAILWHSKFALLFRHSLFDPDTGEELDNDCTHQPPGPGSSSHRRSLVPAAQLESFTSPQNVNRTKGDIALGYCHEQHQTSQGRFARPRRRPRRGEALRRPRGQAQPR